MENKTSAINIQVDSNVKKEATDVLTELGLSMSSAINLFLKQVVKKNGIPFEIKKPKYNKATIQALEDTKNQKNLSKTFNNVDEMFEELNK